MGEEEQEEEEQEEEEAKEDGGKWKIQCKKTSKVARRTINSLTARSSSSRDFGTPMVQGGRGGMDGTEGAAAGGGKPPGTAAMRPKLARRRRARWGDCTPGHGEPLTR